MNWELPDVQAGFRKGRGTRDQIANIQRIIENIREFQQNIYFCFIGDSLIAQLVKNPPAIQETLVRFRGWEDGEVLGYPLQYSWVSLVAQLVKNPPVMWETWVPSLGWEDLLKKRKATHSSILAWRTPWTIQSLGSQRIGHDWAPFTSLIYWTVKFMYMHNKSLLFFAENTVIH